MKPRGFTLLELIVALGIIMTGVVAVFGLFLQTSKTQRAQEGNTLALTLAQEGIEVVRLIRDSNWLAGCPQRTLAAQAYNWSQGGCFAWDTGLWQPNDGTATAVFADQTNQWSLDFSMADSVRDATSGLFILDSGVIAPKTINNSGLIKMALPYARLITLYPICRDDQQNETVVEPGKDCGTSERVGWRVESTVRWNVGNGYEERTLEDHLYNWR